MRLLPHIRQNNCLFIKRSDIVKSALYSCLPNLPGTRWGSGSETVITNRWFIDLNVMTLVLNIRKGI
jgi:hypothetical protein